MKKITSELLAGNWKSKSLDPILDLPFDCFLNILDNGECEITIHEVFDSRIKDQLKGNLTISQQGDDEAELSIANKIVGRIYQLLAEGDIVVEFDSDLLCILEEPNVKVRFVRYKVASKGNGKSIQNP